MSKIVQASPDIFKIENLEQRMLRVVFVKLMHKRKTVYKKSNVIAVCVKTCNCNLMRNLINVFCKVIAQKLEVWLCAVIALNAERRSCKNRNLLSNKLFFEFYQLLKYM